MGGGDGLAVRKYCVCQNQKKQTTAATVASSPAQKKTTKIVSESDAINDYAAKNAEPERLSAESSEYIVVSSGLVRCCGKTKKEKRCRRTKKNPCVLHNELYFCDLHELQAMQPVAQPAFFLIQCSGVTLKGARCQRMKLEKGIMKYFCFQHK